MALKIVSNVGYNNLAVVLPQVKELNFDTADIWLDFNNQALELYTNNGRVTVNFNSYDELLNAIIAITRELAFRDVLNTLNRVIDDLTFYMEHPQLKITEDVKNDLLKKVEKAKERLFNSNYKAMIKMGQLPPKYIDSFIQSNVEVNKAVMDATKKYRELCWKTYEDGDPDYCDYALPLVDVIYYAIPEEKSIVIIVDVDQIGEVYRIIERYDTAYDFLKAVDEYSNKVIGFW